MMYLKIWLKVAEAEIFGVTVTLHADCSTNGCKAFGEEIFGITVTLHTDCSMTVVQLSLSLSLLVDWA